MFTILLNWFGGWQAKLLAAAVIFALGAAGAGWVIHKIDLAAYSALVATQATATAAQERQDRVALEQAVAEEKVSQDAAQAVWAKTLTADAKQTQTLESQLEAAGHANPTLNQCFNLHLPGSVLNSLSR